MLEALLGVTERSLSLSIASSWGQTRHQSRGLAAAGPRRSWSLLLGALSSRGLCFPVAIPRIWA